MEGFFKGAAKGAIVIKSGLKFTALAIKASASFGDRLYTQVVRRFVRQQVYDSLLLIIMLRFICGEREICSTIKMSQNIMNMIVDPQKSSMVNL